MRKNQLRELVEECLRLDEQARNDDYILYLDVCKAKGVSLDMTAEEYFRHRKRFPSYDGVSRARRKIQEEGLYLATESTRKVRRINKDKYIKEYAV